MLDAHEFGLEFCTRRDLQIADGRICTIEEDFVEADCSKQDFESVQIAYGDGSRRRCVEAIL